MVAKIIDHIQSHRNSMILLGRMLQGARDTQIWHDEIGEGINTWFDFVNQPEIGLAVSEANFLINLHELSVKHGVGEMTRVPTATAKYMVRHGGDIMDAQLLSTKDYKKKYFEDKTGREAGFTYAMMKISEDGTMTKVYGDELQIAKHQITNGRV